MKLNVNIGDSAVTSSIRIAQAFPRVGWQKDSRYMEGLRGKIKYIINYALYLSHYDAYSHINDGAKKCRYLSITFSHNSFKLVPQKVL